MVLGGDAMTRHRFEWWPSQLTDDLVYYRLAQDYHVVPDVCTRSQMAALLWQMRENYGSPARIERRGKVRRWVWVGVGRGKFRVMQIYRNAYGGAQ